MLENSTATPADLTAALQAVRYLVEPIDMANGVPLCSAWKQTWLVDVIALCELAAARWPAPAHDTVSSKACQRPVQFV